MVLFANLRRPERHFVLQEIARFSADSEGQTVEEAITFPRGFDKHFLWLSIHNYSTNAHESIYELMRNAGKLRFDLQIHDRFGQKLLLNKEVEFKANATPHPIKGMEEFGSIIRGVDLDSLLQEDYSGQVYLLKLRIVQPVEVTNQFRMWLYSQTSVD